MKKTLCFAPAHPSQFWFFRRLAHILEDNFQCTWIVRDKDVLLQLADKLLDSYHVLTRAKTGLIPNAFEFVFATIRALAITNNISPNIIVSKYGPLNIAAKFRSQCISISFNDDDANIVPIIALTSYPFSQHILGCHSTNFGMYSNKVKRFVNFFEEFYLHPNWFTPDYHQVTSAGISPSSPYCVVRLSSLKAHHDLNAAGLKPEDVLDVIESLPELNFYISSEYPLPDFLLPYRLNCPAYSLHHILHFASLVLTDSQSVATEASMLSTPSVRCNSFVGKISTMNLLDEKELSYSFLPSEIDKLKSFVTSTDWRMLKIKHVSLIEKYFAENPDPAPLFVSFFEQFADA